jgi:preprotein translocase subunit SecF
MNFLTRINYMKNAKTWVTLSIILTVISLGALFGLGLKTGIDFTGGQMYDVQFEGTVTQEQVRDVVSKIVDEVDVQGSEPKSGAGSAVTGFFVRTPELTEEQRAELLKGFESLGKYEVVGEDNVSGTVSKELTQKATLAIIVAALLQVVYIWIRFDFRFGVTAVAALLHDTAITLGIMAIFRVQIDSNFVAAILTVLGYSMNDTVVVIDRIRENLHRRSKGETLEQMTTRSIQEVITRSLYTGVSVQAMLVSMLVFGGDSLWDFSMTLLIGVTAGTYSSIFIASALWLFWSQWDDKRKKAIKGQTAKA